MPEFLTVNQGAHAETRLVRISALASGRVAAWEEDE